MLKRIICVVLCLLLFFSLCACEQEQADSSEETTEFTIPTLDATQAPDDILGDAARRTGELEGFFADYVRIIGEERFALSVQAEIQNGQWAAQTLQGFFGEDGTIDAPVYRYYENNLCFEKKEEQVQRLPSESPYTLPQIFQDILPIPEGLTDRFSGRTLHAIPSEDGSIRFQISDLTPGEFETITGIPCGEGEATVALTVAGEGYLSKLEFTAPAVQITLTIRQATQEEPLTKPDWAK